MPSRRVVLTAGGTVLAGCLDGITTTSPTTILLGVVIRNDHRRTAHDFTLRIERDGEVIHTSTHSLARAGTEAESRVELSSCPWGRDKGSYTVAIRVDDGEWIESDFTDEFEELPDRVVADAIYRADTGLDIAGFSGQSEAVTYGPCSMTTDSGA